jgi:hypothetical protein
MKRYFPVILILLSELLYGQNFQNICSPGVTFFQDRNQTLKAFRLDSVLPGNNDTIFFSYHSIVDTGGVCSDTTQGSILGRKICKKNNGWFYFYNRYNDSIRINSQAALNETWRFCDLDNGSYVQAMVTGIATENFLGISEPVKRITLQAKNGQHNNIQHILNQKQIKLSQHHGLTRMFHVYFLPDDSTEYSLAGKSHPPLGIQELDWKAIYDYQIGDAFHYAGYGQAPASSAVWAIREYVIGKTVYGNNDSVTYKIKRCEEVQGGPPPFSYTYNDTITENYNFNKLANDLNFYNLPEEFDNVGNSASRYYRKTGFSNHRQTKGIALDVWSNPNPPYDCWSKPYPETYSIQEYTEGLGCTYDHFEYSWNYLVYYQKGSETWGTPVTTDCDITFGTQPNINPGTQRMKIFPDPATSQVEILLEGYGSQDYFHFVLYDSSGNPVREGISESMPFHLNRDELSAGLYLLILRGRDGGILEIGKLVFN